MNLLTVVYSRMSSTRFPNKALCNILNETMVERVARSVSDFAELGEVIIGTSDDLSDDQLAAYCEKIGLSFFRGNLTNVALRTQQIIQKYKPEFICRICGDRPLLTPDFVQYAKNTYLTNRFKYDLVTNLRSQLDPPGLKIEFIKSTTFIEHSQNFNSSEREHITKYFYDECNFDQNRVYNFDFSTKNHSSVNLCVDTPEDLEKVKLTLEAIINYNLTFNHRNVLALIQDF